MATTLVRCAECLFWEAYPDRQLGVCRRHGPSAQQHDSASTTPVANVRWPATSAVDWCGDSVPMGAARPAGPQY